MNSPQVWIRLGSFFMFAGVLLGAFGAHILKRRLPPDLFEIFEVGVRYHIYHALALFIVAWVADRFGGSTVGWVGAAFTAGILVFSGSLYLLSLTGLRWLGAITPLGGLAFMAGWLMLVRLSFQIFK